MHRLTWAGPGLGLAVALAAAAAETNPGTGEGWTSIPLAVDRSNPAGFTLLAPDTTGIHFTNALSELAGAGNRVLENGSGVAAGDYDGDGWPDLFLARLNGQSRLYRNQRDGRFADATPTSGLALDDESVRGAVLTDLNGDRRPDLLVSTHARGVRCFLNDSGKFRETTAEAGTSGIPGSTTLALADVDGNGTLDLYVARYRAEDIRDASQIDVRRVGGRVEPHPKYAGRLVIGPRGLMEFGEPDVLFLNDGHARFRPVSWTDGHFRDEEGHVIGAPPRDWGLTASFRDLNGDRLPDLYVCNDYWTPDRLWINAGNGTFRLAPATSLRHTSENSMGVDFADVDRDGLLDFLVLDMLDPDPRVRRRQMLAQSPAQATPGEILNRPQIMRNTLFRGRRDGTFAEIAEFAGLGRSGWSWQPLFLDVDLDGYEDVLIPSGHRTDVQDLDATERIRALQHPWPATQDPRARHEAFLREKVEHARLYPALNARVVAFRNLGGFRFANVTEAWGFRSSAVHQGSALLDWDRDGDLDLAVNCLNGPARLYRNTGGAARVAVRLRGLPPNTEGIGAVVRVRARARGGLVPEQFQEVVAGGRYLSGSEPLLVFAAGPAAQPLEIEVTWRLGQISVVAPVVPDQLYEIDEAFSRPPRPTSTVPTPEPLFEDASARLGHVHHEDRPPEAALQPLLHRWLSQGGPGIAVVDLDANAWPDLVLGTGTGGTWAAFTNDTRGGFAPAPGIAPPAPLSADVTGLATYRDSAGRPCIVFGSQANASPGAAPANVAVWSPSPNPAIQPLPGTGGAVGPLALGDLDGDGQLDLFVGGAAIPGRYPEAAPSRILRRRKDAWVLDEANTAVLRDVGVVNGAVWGDLDGDGDGDLALACEWSPVRVFRSVDGRLVDVTREWGFEPSSGWWLGIELADLDEDGRLDVVAGNWGGNSPYSASPEQPAVLVFGDLLGRDAVDLLEGEWDPLRRILAPRRRLDELHAALPTLRGIFPTHAAFVPASLDDVVRAFGRDVRRVEARTLASTVFYRRGDRFEPVALPAEAQYAPVFGTAVADFDGDGHADLFLAQNAFALPEHLPRLDAGQGLLLRGTGSGGFSVVDATTSGIRADGEQRGAVVGDFDRDGRPDLVVGQNGAPTRFFRNRGAVAGIRVRLHDGPGNPDGVGAVAWVGSPEQPRATRAVRSGSGWWSQGSPELILPRPPDGGTVTARWSDGQLSTVEVPRDRDEIVIRRDRESAAR